MRTIWIFSNAVVVVTTLVCTSYLYYACRPIRRGKLPIASILVVAVTAVVSSLAFIYPDLLGMLQRDPAAVRAGEVWRLGTALFVQPNGLVQALANGFLIAVFMPAAERLYRRNVLAVYFASGLVGQSANYAWNSGIGGSSTAIFGLMGSILIYVVRYRRELLLPFRAMAVVGLLGSVVMLMSRDGHGVGLVVGTLVAWRLSAAGMQFRDKATDVFDETAAAPEAGRRGGGASV